MQIQSGKLYENRTWKYVYPCLKSYGGVLKGYLNSLYKMAVTLGDSNADFEEKHCIYILVDTNISTTQTSVGSYRENLSKFLDWVRFQPYYVIDYIFDGLETSEKHMIVLRIPDIYTKAVEKFKKGRYSEMYSSKEIRELFPYVSIDNKEIETRINTKTKQVRNVLTKNKEYLPIFQKQVNEEFGVKCSLKDLEDHELDFPPVLKEEIFNFEKELIT